MPGPEDQPIPREEIREGQELLKKLAGLNKEAELLEENELYRRRFLRAHEIVARLTEVYAHFMEPPAVELYFDGSGAFYVGEKTLEAMEDHGRGALENVVGSSRWEVVRRPCNGGLLRYALKFCHLNLDTKVSFI